MGIYLIFICIAPRSLDIYIVRSRTGRCSSIHLPPSIQPFCLQPLKLSIGSIAKDSYSPPPFSEINRYLISFNFFFLIYILFLSAFLLISFMLHVSDLCALVHSIQITISECFCIFVHSCMCSITVLQNNKVLLHPAICILSSAEHLVITHIIVHVPLESSGNPVFQDHVPCCSQSCHIHIFMLITSLSYSIYAS